MSRKLYAVHRWIAAVAFVQLAVWTISGLLFATIPQQSVKGQAVPGAHDVPVGDAAGVLSAPQAVACLATLGLQNPSRLDLRASPAGLFYIGRANAEILRIDARSCTLAPVDAAEAEQTARRDQPNHPALRSIERIEEAGVEYRGKPVPAFRVVLDDADTTVVYVDARTGEVTARRTNTWRTFDFLWSLHTMTYKTRDDINNPLLVIAASLAVLTVISGSILWVIRIVRWRMGKVAQNL